MVEVLGQELRERREVGLGVQLLRFQPGEGRMQVHTSLAALATSLKAGMDMMMDGERFGGCREERTIRVWGERRKG